MKSPTKITVMLPSTSAMDAACSLKLLFPLSFKKAIYIFVLAGIEWTPFLPVGLCIKITLIDKQGRMQIRFIIESWSTRSIS